jgi:hypothetical protein
MAGGSGCSALDAVIVSHRTSAMPARTSEKSAPVRAFASAIATRSSSCA